MEQVSRQLTEQQNKIELYGPKKIPLKSVYRIKLAYTFKS
jgi:hypothetical protein